MGRFFALVCLAVLASACTAGNNKAAAVVTPAVTSRAPVAAQATGAAVSPISTVSGTAVPREPRAELPTCWPIRTSTRCRAKALFGTLDRATYQIEVPGKVEWRPGHVRAWLHRQRPRPVRAPPPLRAYFIAPTALHRRHRASRHRLRLNAGLVDTLGPRDYFVSSVAEPARTIMYGPPSMGGHVIDFSDETLSAVLCRWLL